MAEKKKEKPNQKKNPPEEPEINPYLKYSTMGIQMAVIIGGGVWLGTWLDEKYKTSTPYYTIAISLFAIFAALYISLREILKK